MQAETRYQVRDGERWVVWDADGWRLVESLFTAGRAQPAIEAEVSLGYASPDGAYAVSVGQRATSAARSSGREHAEPRYHVGVERDGTLVELAGSDLTLLRDLARALAPAPAEAPRLPPR